VVALGHADPQIAKLLQDQALELIHCSNLYHSPWPARLAQLIVNTTKTLQPNSPLSKIFFTNSGTEANEGALKFARKVGKIRGGQRKTGIVCFERGFHGRTFGALSVTAQTKYQAPFAPLVPGVKVGKLNDVAALEDLVTEDTCGVIVEPIQGEGGVFEASEEFLRALRKRCDYVGSVLIYDEIQVYISGVNCLMLTN
jgi:acetylornithine aminotransferase